MDKVIPTNGTSAEDIKYANTVKKVYIDGVDVSGCEFYQIEANQLYPNAQYCGSMRNTFCENEPDCYYKQLKRLKEDFKDTTDGLLKIQYTLADSCKKYEQCLKEIKEIILEMCGEQCGACFIEMCNQKCRYAKIQAKINEVIGAE